MKMKAFGARFHEFKKKYILAFHSNIFGLYKKNLIYWANDGMPVFLVQRRGNSKFLLSKKCNLF